MSRPVPSVDKSSAGHPTRTTALERTSQASAHDIRRLLDARVRGIVLDGFLYFQSFNRWHGDEVGTSEENESSNHRYSVNEHMIYLILPYGPRLDTSARDRAETQVLRITSCKERKAKQTIVPTRLEGRGSAEPTSCILLSIRLDESLPPMYRLGTKC